MIILRTITPKPDIVHVFDLITIPNLIFISLSSIYSNHYFIIIFNVSFSIPQIMTLMNDTQFHYHLITISTKSIIYLINHYFILVATINFYIIIILI